MKVFKKFIIFSFLFGLTFLSSCSECDSENPRARVSNLGTEDVSVQVKTSGGNTENINNIEPGKASEYRSYAPGEITYTIVLKNNEEIVEVVEMDFCSDYEIIINENNEIRTTATNRD
ncbi:hypothetical protein ACOSP6_11420 [Tenacibaculum sp. MEBiC06402]|uniref:hypothetical protein n=1 Tax=unclassified Tenacibaculum TaxID=2635139 RepID=UPI003B9B8B7E